MYLKSTEMKCRKCSAVHKWEKCFLRCVTLGTEDGVLAQDVVFFHREFHHEAIGEGGSAQVVPGARENEIQPVLLAVPEQDVLNGAATALMRLEEGHVSGWFAGWLVRVSLVVLQLRFVLPKIFISLRR